jgi:anti-sigma B factor antagonist
MSSLTLRIHEEPATVTIQCSGRLVAGVTDTLYKEVKTRMERGRVIVLDLTELAQMDSMGLGTIVRLYASSKSAGCQLELINLSKRVRELFGITGLLSVLESCGEQRMRMP